MKPIDHLEWQALAAKLFGPNPKDWAFVCPVCGTRQTIRDFEEHTDLPENEIEDVIAFSCIGRWARGGCEHPGLGPSGRVRDDGGGKAAMGCDYAGGGLFQLNPTAILFNGEIHRRFAFAESAPTEKS